MNTSVNWCVSAGISLRAQIITRRNEMSGAVVHFGNFSLDEELDLLDRELRAYQRIWLIERSKIGTWGIAVVRDLPEHQWPEANENGYIPDSSKYETIVYRRHECLAKAVHDARQDLIMRNEGDDQESQDSEAEEKFLQPINPDPVSRMAADLKDK